MTVTPKPTGGVGMDPVANALSIILMIAIIGAAWILFGGYTLVFKALIAVIVGGALVGFGVHFVPVGGAPAAMGQAPGIATVSRCLRPVRASPASSAEPSRFRKISASGHRLSREGSAGH